jgi:geranylgeranylglycerol-phosphate geranylgeranyltransferase
LAVAARPALRVRLPAMVELLRPGNCAITALGIAVGAYVQAGPAIAGLLPQVALAAVAGFAFAGAGNALNDYVDRAIDATAHPERPLPSGRATPRDALRVQTLGFTLALIAAGLVSLACAAFVLASMVLMTAYDLRVKTWGWPGNVSIGLLTGAPFVFGALAVGGIGPSVLVLAFLAVLATLGREIIKDVEDMAGDMGHRRTLPVRLGAPRATRLAQAALLAGVALSPLPFLVQPRLGVAYLAVVALADAGFLAAAWVAAQPHRAQQLCKLSMLVALAAFAAGRALP